jgi:hypothetical protein
MGAAPEPGDALMTVIRPALAPPLISSRRTSDGSRIFQPEVPLEAHEDSLGLLVRRWAAEAPERLVLAERDGREVGRRSASRRRGARPVPDELAREIGSAHHEVMSRSILDFYRSAVPNVAADWWKDVTSPTRSRRLVLLLPDPPEAEAMSLEVAERLGAQTARLEAR